MLALLLVLPLVASQANFLLELMGHGLAAMHPQRFQCPAGKSSCQGDEAERCFHPSTARFRLVCGTNLGELSDLNARGIKSRLRLRISRCGVQFAMLN